MLNVTNITKKLHRKYGTNDPFIIASEMGIIISKQDLGTIRGFYHKAYRIKQIVLNENLNDYDKKFVMAHELGHAILHPDCNTMFLKANSRISVDKMELEANIFAICLLVDDEQLKDYKFNGYSISTISRILGYSEELIKLRLKSQ